MLCVYCKKVILDIIRQDFSSWELRDFGTSASLDYHENYQVSTEVTSNGCELCEYFKPAIILWRERRPWSPNPCCRANCYFSNEEAGRTKSVFGFLISEDQFSLNNHVGDRLEFQIFISADSVEATPLVDQNLRLPRLVASWPDSPDCIALIKRWLEQCENTHTTCVRQADVRMPTRVIDVGFLGPESAPRLVQTNGSRDRYLTLSYCWGKDGNVTTNTRNFAEHIQAIDTQALPRTLRDAVAITRLLGFRYLWIDALCIIQDDSADWEREAAKMCSVYEGAALSLSALDSPSSNAGFLTPRELSQVSFSVNGINISIDKPLGQARQAIPGAPLETRAWTLQERVLAPALIHFRSSQLLWECGAGMATETDPAVRAQKQVQNSAYYGASVHDMKKMLHDRTEVQDTSLWYNLVEQYTQRFLTRASDRLPAMNGLMERFEHRIKEKCVFGLWPRDFHIGLLWYTTDLTSASVTVNSYERNPIQEMPSWSWLCVDIPVSFRSKSDSVRLITRATIELIETSSVLKILCLRQVGVCYRASKHNRGCSFYSDTSLSGFDRIQCNLDEIDESIRSSCLIPKVYHCLLLAEEERTGSITFEYIIAEEVESGLDTNTMRTFRRAGIGHQNISERSGTGILANAVEEELHLI